MRSPCYSLRLYDTHSSTDSIVSVNDICGESNNRSRGARDHGWAGRGEGEPGIVGDVMGEPAGDGARLGVAVGGDGVAVRVTVGVNVASLVGVGVDGRSVAVAGKGVGDGNWGVVVGDGAGLDPSRFAITYAPPAPMTIAPARARVSAAQNHGELERGAAASRRVLRERAASGGRAPSAATTVGAPAPGRIGTRRSALANTRALAYRSAGFSLSALASTASSSADAPMDNVRRSGAGAAIL